MTNLNQMIFRSYFLLVAAVVVVGEILFLVCLYVVVRLSINFYSYCFFYAHFFLYKYFASLLLFTYALLFSFLFIYFLFEFVVLYCGGEIYIDKFNLWNYYIYWYYFW